jgi:hypothetical protein
VTQSGQFTDNDRFDIRQHISPEFRGILQIVYHQLPALMSSVGCFGFQLPGNFASPIHFYPLTDEVVKKEACRMSINAQ